MTFDPAAGVARASLPRPGRASFSMLDKWMSCPARWAAEKLMPKPRLWGSPLVLGGIVHAALELACATPDVVAPDWRALCAKGVGVEYGRWRMRGWGDEPIPSGVAMPDGSPAMQDDWVAAAALKLSGFVLTDALGRVLEPAALEQDLEADVDGIPLRGAVDYRDVDGTVVDWKTGGTPKYRDARRRHADQLRLYRLMLEADGVCEVRAARDVYVEHHAWAAADLSDAACTDTVSRFHHAWDGIVRATGADGSGVLPLRPSGLCAWCPVARACPLARIVPSGQRDVLSSVGPDDPRVGFAGTHTGGWNHVGKEPVMLDLFGLDAPVAETKTGEVKPAAVARPRAGLPEPAPDPWETPQGRETMDRWMGSGPGEDPWNPTPEPKPEPEAAEPAPAETGVTLTERKPYDPSWSDGRANVAGYGFTQLTLTFARAGLLADGHADRIRPIALELLRVQWAAARKAYGPIVPDVPGLADGRPERSALFAWLDSTLARDVERVIRLILDSDGDGEGTLDARLERIRAAGRLAALMLAESTRMLRGDA
ncbi:RecB family exonuclease [Bifidobacterium longum]|uniref:RecB family exonuclease n=1 Tax=Bifidobacterium longum TaxID=216816 RepID=UPI0030F4A2EA